MSHLSRWRERSTRKARRVRVVVGETVALVAAAWFGHWPLSPASTRWRSMRVIE